MHQKVGSKNTFPESFFNIENSKIFSFVLAYIKNISSIFSYIFPIASREVPKFLLLSLLMFCILGVQNLVRAMKDSVVNTMIGTETISFLKFWGVLPAAFLVTIAYVKLTNVMRGEHIFYLILMFFLSFFALFGFYLFPNYELLHLSKETSNDLVLAYPHFKWFVLLLGSWSFSLFYIMAELWPNAMFALLFWQFVNGITTVEESKRFYPLFSVLGQTGLIVSGNFLNKLPVINEYLVKKLSLNIDSDVLTIKLVISVIVFLGIVAALCFMLINKYILDIKTVQAIRFKAKKQKATLKESFKMVMESKYIRLIALLLICYGMAINLVEGPWKKTASTVYTNPTDFAAFVGGYLSDTGWLTIILAFVGSAVIRKFGWLAAAIITPIMVFITGISFFMISNFDYVRLFVSVTFLVSDPLLIAVLMGAWQNALSKSCKYTLFDSTKEMSYVPLGDQLKSKGKAAADVMGIKIGKSSSAFIQFLIFTIVPTASYQSISIYLMVVFTMICLLWIWCVMELGKEYKKACIESLSNVVE